MISTDISHIVSQLDDIESRYLKSEPGGNDASIYALAYILMLSSWIEEFRNYLSCQMVDAFFAPSDGSEKIKKQVCQINGFKFSEHFKRAFAQIVGEHGFLEIQSNCNERTMVLLESALGKIWEIRCMAAHKTFEGLQNKSFYAPSIIKPDRDRVIEGLQELERSISSLHRNTVLCKPTN